MSECKTCGRPDEGHWIGCVQTAHSAESIVWPEPSADILDDASEITDDMPEVCAFGECIEPRWSNAPRAQFCATHKDPKNRK